MKESESGLDLVLICVTDKRQGGCPKVDLLPTIQEVVGEELGL